MNKLYQTKKLELNVSPGKVPPPPPILHKKYSYYQQSHIITTLLLLLWATLTIGCSSSEIDTKTQITGSISYQNIQVNYGIIASRTVDLTGITPYDATNSDYRYSVTPALPNGVILNPSDGIISVANNVPEFSNTYTIAATVAENDPKYKGSVTGIISISIKDTRTQITGNINYQNIQIDYGTEANSTVSLTGVAPYDATNSDYIYSVTPALPNGVILNPSDGIISVANNAPGFSNTYTITATVAENDLKYKGSVTGTISIKVAHFSARERHSIVEFKNTLYLIGGYDSSDSHKNDVWTSTDGITWTEATNQANFPERKGHSVVEFKDALYLIGGYDDNDRKNDVWTSTDGITWIEVTNHANFSERMGHSVVEFKDALYLIGGNDGNSKNDVWKSTDGVTWTEVTNHANFSERFVHSVVEFKSALYLIGGYRYSGNQVYNNDVWKSTDGVTWTEVTNHANFSERASHIVVEFKDALYLIGGNNQQGYYNDVWKSTDGSNWTEVSTTQPKFSVRTRHSVVVFKDGLYLIGGKNGNNSYENDVWKSTDGIDWEQKL